MREEGRGEIVFGNFDCFSLSRLTFTEAEAEARRGGGARGISVATEYEGRQKSLLPEVFFSPACTVLLWKTPVYCIEAGDKIGVLD